MWEETSMSKKNRGLNKKKPIIVALIIVIVFFTTYMLTSTYVVKHLDDIQYKACEEVAQNIHEQRDKLPEGIICNVTSNNLIVTFDGYMGNITVDLENDDFVPESNSEIGFYIFFNVVVSLIVSLMGYLLYMFGENIYLQCKNKKDLKPISDDVTII